MRWPLTLASVLAPGLSAANPAGGQVVAGQATINAPNAGTLVINQSSHSAAINWQQFSVGSNEYVVFNQPSASSTVLNRVVGGMPSEILGNISANGRVFLVNPNGIAFGRGAQVDVGGLVASTMDIGNDDFLKGRYVFAGAPGGGGKVSNAGGIDQLHPAQARHGHGPGHPLLESGAAMGHVGGEVGRAEQGIEQA